MGYRVHYQVVGPSEGGSVDQEFLQEASTPASEEQVVLQRLEKWTHYRVSVSASTVVGPGPESEPLVCRTDEDGTVLCFVSSTVGQLNKHLEIAGLKSGILMYSRYGGSVFFFFTVNSSFTTKISSTVTARLFFHGLNSLDVCLGAC